MVEKELKSIDFEGKLVTPKNGGYRCPYKCHSAGYPAPKWKTEKGFIRHMETCKARPSLVKINSLKRVNDQLKLAELKQKCLESSLVTFKIGDVIHYVGYYVTKPTHVQRFNKMVRVRYEEERRYYSKSDIITSIDFNINEYHINLDVEYIIKRFLIINGSVYPFDIKESIEDAKKCAAESQKAYDDACEHAYRCR